MEQQTLPEDIRDKIINEFLLQLIEELPKQPHNIDTSKWEYEHGDCCDSPVDFVARFINGLLEQSRESIKGLNRIINMQVEISREQSATIKELLQGLENALKQFGGLGNTDDLKQLLNKHKP